MFCRARPAKRDKSASLPRPAGFRHSGFLKSFTHIHRFPHCSTSCCALPARSPFNLWTKAGLLPLIAGLTRSKPHYRIGKCELNIFTTPTNIRLIAITNYITLLVGSTFTSKEILAFARMTSISNITTSLIVASSPTSTKLYHFFRLMV